MKFFLKSKLSLGLAVAITGLIAAPAFADSNGSGPVILNTGTTMSLGGPFNHDDGAGSPGNSTTTATFSESFAANEILIEGDVTGVLPFNAQFFLGEADIVVTDGAAGTVTWQNPVGTVPDTTTGPQAYSATAVLANAGGTGTFSFEFIDSFDDGAGADSISNNVTATLLEVQAASDTTGSFALGSPAVGTPATNLGEFLVGGIFDTYTLTAGSTGFLSVETDQDPTGLAASIGGALDTVDTEWGLFDSTGTLIAYSDDEGNGLYSLISGLFVNAGDTFTVGVTGFGSTISAAGVGSFQLADLDGGTSTGDYVISASIEAVPEPTAFGLLAVAGLVGLTRRRR